MTREELLSRLAELNAELSELDPEQHVEHVREAMAEAARNGADDETLREHAAMLRHAVAGSDDFGCRRTVVVARKEAAEAELAELEAGERERQRKALAEEVIEAGNRLQEAAIVAARAFRDAVKAHVLASTWLERRERAKAILAGRVFDGVSKGGLFKFPALSNMHGDILPASAFALNEQDAEFKQILAEAGREIEMMMKGETA